MDPLYEVELKFAVADIAELRSRLESAGGRYVETRQQSDHYFNHPCRDFAQTDEALRLRRDGPNWAITYKGPKLDAATKTRAEIELPLAGAAEDWKSLLLALGFRPVAEVDKTRQYLELPFEGQTVSVTLDHLQPLGWFVELELTAGVENLDSQRDCLLRLAEQLDLSTSERRSYLELLLTHRESAP